MSAVKIMGFMMALLVLLCGASTADAQMAPQIGTTSQIIYQDEDPAQLALFLYKLNLCIERVGQLNPHLDLNKLPYGARLTIPNNEPCYDYQRGEFGSSVVPPRLKYYANGEWLKVPYYSPDVTYLHVKTIDAISEQLNICEKELLAENIGLQLYPVMMGSNFASVDIFLPENITCRLRPDDEKARVQAYHEDKYYIFGDDYQATYLRDKLGFCREQVTPISYSNIMLANYYDKPTQNRFALQLPQDGRPCYDESGRRLAFFDLETGLPLAEPYYSDYRVYNVLPKFRVESVAALFGVCVFDLMRLNGFAEMTFYRGTLDVLIPPARPCDETLELVRFPIPRRWWGFPYTALIIASLNVCPAQLTTYNPNLDRSAIELNTLYSDRAVEFELMLILPADRTPCYVFHRLMPDETIYDLERAHNVCHEEFLLESVLPHYPLIEPNGFRKMYYIPYDAAPCYNDAGQRLEYPLNYDSFTGKNPDGLTPAYNEMALDIFRAGDTVYAVSQRNNVCVHDILAANPVLRSARPRGLPVFIPDARPCYDAETGRPLVYEDEQGQPLPEPIVGDALYYYGSQPLGRISYYYNICANRIADANYSKMRWGERHMISGWLIPTERPPCYDEQGAPISYACYTYPLDMKADYRDAPNPVAINIDGRHCYNLRDPETVIWQHNRPYIMIDVKTMDDWPLSSNAFIASCFGVSHAETNAISENVTIREILPYQTKAIPLPTRDCYLMHPAAHDRWGMTTHVVRSDETLSTIGARYSVPWPLIAFVNQLGPDNMLWLNQELLIPDALYRGALVLIGGFAASLAAVLVIRRRW